MLRKVIKIYRDACIGCGMCASACQQGAIQMVDGKAKLVNENHCDGLGECLPHCPVDAITMVEKEVSAPAGGAGQSACASTVAKPVAPKKVDDSFTGEISSRLTTWPVQIKLANPLAPYFDGADLLIAADCCSFSYGDFHRKFMQDKVTLIGCPKLDAVDYSEKLSDIIANNNINSITVTRMTVPCCGGTTNAVKKAVMKSGKNIPINVYVISTDGNIVQNEVQSAFPEMPTSL